MSSHGNWVLLEDQNLRVSVSFQTLLLDVLILPNMGFMFFFCWVSFIRQGIGSIKGLPLFARFCSIWAGLESQQWLEF